MADPTRGLDAAAWLATRSGVAAGSARVLSDSASCAYYANDIFWQPGVTPRAVVLPQTRAQAVEAVKTAATSTAVTDHINRTIALGNDLGINGTPTFIVGDKAIDGARIDELKAAVRLE